VNIPEPIEASELPTAPQIIVSFEPNELEIKEVTYCLFTGEGWELMQEYKGKKNNPFSDLIRGLIDTLLKEKLRGQIIPIGSLACIAPNCLA